MSPSAPSKRWMQSFVNTFPCIISMHSLFCAFYLHTKARLGYHKPLYFPPMDFCMLKIGTAKRRSLCFSPGCLWKAEMHQCLWLHIDHLVLGYRTTQKWRRRAGWILLSFGQKKEACSPFAIDKWATNPPMLCPRRHSSKEPARMC